MARMNGVPKNQAGPIVRLVYRYGPGMTKKLTGRDPQIGNGIEPMEIWAHQPKMLMGMGKFRRRAACAATLSRECAVHRAREAGPRLHGRGDADAGRGHGRAVRQNEGALQRQAARRDHSTADGREHRPVQRGLRHRLCRVQRGNGLRAARSPSCRRRVNATAGCIVQRLDGAAIRETRQQGEPRNAR
jgi:hypothetical protein